MQSKDARADTNRRYYMKNKESQYERNLANRNKARQFVRELKDGRECMDCGHSFPHYVLQWDHREDEAKVKAIATMVSQCYGISTIQAEIEKCDLVCANCHSVRTHTRRSS